MHAYMRAERRKEMHGWTNREINKKYLTVREWKCEINIKSIIIQKRVRVHRCNKIIIAIIETPLDQY
jgi:hypothetical protein